MNAPDPVQTAPPAAAPWYTSKILQGILTIIVTQLIAKITAQFKIDFSVLGLDANSVVAWLMNIISVAGAAYAARAKVTQKAAPVMTGTKSTADQINAVNPSGAPIHAPVIPPSPESNS
jgi:hypothetical protein